jgi:hypothetical protein
MPNDGIGSDKAFEAYKFLQEAAQESKGHAWSQTTWLLTLNAGVLAFSFNLYAEYRDDIPRSGFLVIEWISAVAGAALCVLLLVVLRELGKHISRYWARSDDLVEKHPFLLDLQPNKARRTKKVGEGFPKFCRRLRYFAWLFIVADLAWAVIVTGLRLAEGPFN